MLGRRSQTDFEDEVRSHLQLEVDRLKRSGMSEPDAMLAARRKFGNVGVASDRFYHGRRFASLDDILRDMRHAFRGLRRSPGFLITAVVTLALAIGAVAGMFDVVNTILLRPLPYPHPEQIYVLQGTAPGSDLPPQFDTGSEFYVHFKENAKLLDGIFMFNGGTSTFRVADRVERIRMLWPTNDMYATLGVQPQVGRLPRTEDRDDAVVLSDKLWTTWFNRDPSVIGKWYFVSDSMKQVIGVMPKGFGFPNDSVMLYVAGETKATDVKPGNFGVPIIARLKNGVTPERASAELKQLASQLPARFGGSATYARTIGQYRPVITPVVEAYVGPTAKTALLILLGAVMVVMLVACANVANLFLVRAETRRRDLTVRRAIGATRAQLFRFQLTEALVVALIAGVVAIALAAVALPALVRAAPDGIPRLNQVHIDPATIGIAFLLVLFVTLVCGAIPAIRASAPDLTGLRSGGRGSIGGRQWGRDVLVIAQTALALVLLIGSALLLQSFRRLSKVDPGYVPKDIYTFQFAPDQPSLRDGPSVGQLHLQVMDRIRAMPGVSMVGVVNNIPLDEGTQAYRVKPEGAAPDAEGVQVRMNFAAGDYFKAAGIRLLAGRTFTTDEAITPNNSVIISRSTADKFWPGQDALGHRIYPRFGGQDTLAFTVVGIVNDVKQNDWRDAGDLGMYFPLTGPTARLWSVGSPAYVVKSSRADQMRGEIRRLIHEVAPEAPVYREFTWEFLSRRSMLQLSFTMLTLGVLSVLALVLGAVGLYGTLSYVVAQRTREIGVRMALGATASAVRRQVVSQGTGVVAIGALIGLAVAFYTTRFLAKLLYEVKPVDITAFAVTSAIMIAMGVLASYVPARRASSVAPMEALRSD